MQRLEVLDELLATKRSSLVGLVVNALLLKLSRLTRFASPPIRFQMNYQNRSGNHERKKSVLIVWRQQ